MGKETILYMYIKNKILIQNCVLVRLKTVKSNYPNIKSLTSSILYSYIL